MPMQITDTAITARITKTKTTKGREDLADTTATGLRCRITAKGGKWYYVGKDDLGKVKSVNLGAYPAISIAAAREAARRMRERVRAGEDPTGEKRRKKALGVTDGVATLQDLIDAYTASPAASQSWRRAKTTVEHVFDGLLKTRLDKLKVSDLQIVMGRHSSVSSAGLAGRSLSPCLKYGNKLGYIARELTFIEPPKPPKSRERVLSDDELKALILELDVSQSVYAPPMRFLIWTMSRLNETCKTRWGDVDLETGDWYVRKTKNGKPLVLKLPRQAIEFLKESKPAKCNPSDYIFSNEDGTDNAISNWDRFTKSLQQKINVFDWHRHDLRRTGANKMSALGIDPLTIDAALNHKNLYNPALAAYLKTRPVEQVSQALQIYADWLDVLTKQKADNQAG